MRFRKVSLFQTILNSFVFSIIFLICVLVGIKAFAVLNNVNSGDALNATSWNELVSNIFWKNEGSGNISYTGGNVGIGTNSPTTKLEVSGNIKANNIGPTSFSRIATSISCIGKTKSTWNYSNTSCPSGETIIFVGILNENHSDSHAIACQISGNGVQAGSWCGNNIDANNAVTCYGLCIKN